MDVLIATPDKVSDMKMKWIFIFLLVVITVVSIQAILAVIQEINIQRRHDAEYLLSHPPDSTWIAPSLFTDRETTGKERAMVIYGEELIAHTSKYFGPNGSVAKITNGMNCQNCHLDAGTRPWGNNFGAVFSKYPQYRARSNSIQQISDRVNDCFQRSLNGRAIDTNSYEMQSFYAYFKWLGKNVSTGTKPSGSGLPSIKFIDRPADITKGKIIYTNQCQTCHGLDGNGVLNISGDEYIYPPLWGKQSYNDGAGLYRLGSFAAFIKNNMPFNTASNTTPLLSMEQAWDVAAYVNSQPRPHIDQSKDWPDLTKKAFDVPVGPYADSFSEHQHKYGPYLPIIKQYRSVKFLTKASL